MASIAQGATGGVQNMCLGQGKNKHKNISPYRYPLGNHFIEITNQYKPQPRRLLAMMTSVTASNTKWILLVSVAQVMCEYISLFGDLFRLSY